MDGGLPRCCRRLLLAVVAVVGVFQCCCSATIVEQWKEGDALLTVYYTVAASLLLQNSDGEGGTDSIFLFDAWKEDRQWIVSVDSLFTSNDDDDGNAETGEVVVDWEEALTADQMPWSLHHPNSRHSSQSTDTTTGSGGVWCGSGTAQFRIPSAAASHAGATTLLVALWETTATGDDNDDDSRILWAKRLVHVHSYESVVEVVLPDIHRTIAPPPWATVVGVEAAPSDSVTMDKNASSTKAEIAIKEEENFKEKSVQTAIPWVSWTMVWTVGAAGLALYALVGIVAVAVEQWGTNPVSTPQAPCFPKPSANTTSSNGANPWDSGGGGGGGHCRSGADPSFGDEFRGCTDNGGYAWTMDDSWTKMNRPEHATATTTCAPVGSEHVVFGYSSTTADRGLAYRETSMEQQQYRVEMTSSTSSSSSVQSAAFAWSPTALGMKHQDSHDESCSDVVEAAKLLYEFRLQSPPQEQNKGALIVPSPLAPSLDDGNDDKAFSFPTTTKDDDDLTAVANGKALATIHCPATTDDESIGADTGFNGCNLMTGIYNASITASAASLGFDESKSGHETQATTTSTLFQRDCSTMASCVIAENDILFNESIPTSTSNLVDGSLSPTSNRMAPIEQGTTLRTDVTLPPPNAEKPHRKDDFRNSPANIADCRKPGLLKPDALDALDISNVSLSAASIPKNDEFSHALNLHKTRREEGGAQNETARVGRTGSCSSKERAQRSYDICQQEMIDTSKHDGDLSPGIVVLQYLGAESQDTTLAGRKRLRPISSLQKKRSFGASSPLVNVTGSDESKDFSYVSTLPPDSNTSDEDSFSRLAMPPTSSPTGMNVNVAVGDLSEAKIVACINCVTNNDGDLSVLSDFNDGSNVAGLAKTGEKLTTKSLRRTFSNKRFRSLSKSLSIEASSFDFAKNDVCLSSGITRPTNISSDSFSRSYMQRSAKDFAVAAMKNSSKCLTPLRSSASLTFNPNTVKDVERSGSRENSVLFSTSKDFATNKRESAAKTIKHGFRGESRRNRPGTKSKTPLQPESCPDGKTTDSLQAISSDDPVSYLGSRKACDDAIPDIVLSRPLMAAIESVKETCWVHQSKGSNATNVKVIQTRFPKSITIMPKDPLSSSNQQPHGDRVQANSHRDRSTSLKQKSIVGPVRNVHDNGNRVRSSSVDKNGHNPYQNPSKRRKVNHPPR